MSEDKLLDLYVKEAGKTQLLTKQEEIDLATRAQDGDMEAREQLITCNTRFVISMAHKFRAYAQGPAYSLIDLIQEGNIGLFRAVEKFDVTKGYRFTTYAGWWIRAKMMNYIIRNHDTIRSSTTASERHLFFKMGKIGALLEERDPEKRDEARKILSEEIKVEIRLIKQAEKRIYNKTISLDKPIATSEKETRLGDLIPDTKTSEADLVQRNLVQRAREEMNEALKRLPEKGRQVIQMRFLEPEPRTLQEIANVYGLTRERIRQIEVKMLKQLEPLLRNKEASLHLVKQLAKEE